MPGQRPHLDERFPHVRILITAGPTREYFDSVRFISNPSTGKMGYALAAAAARRGHEVTLVSGPVALPSPAGCRCISVVTAAEMAIAAKRGFRRSDAAILTAAVCDYRPTRPMKRKLAKQNRSRSLMLVPTEDIATSLGRVKRKRVIVGFAMEDHDHRAHAETKLRRKRCDAIVLNGPENVGSDNAVIEIFRADGTWSPRYSASKRAVATRIIRLTESLHEARSNE